jgi:hypothetical protein
MNILAKSLITLFFLCIASLPITAAAADPKRVVDATYVKVNGDIQGFLALVAKGREIGKKLRPDANVNVSVYYTSKAGPYSGTVGVFVVHPSHADWAQAQQVVMASPEWQALMQEIQAAGYEMVSSGLSVEVMTFE